MDIQRPWRRSDFPLRAVRFVVSTCNYLLAGGERREGNAVVMHGREGVTGTTFVFLQRV